VLRPGMTLEYRGKCANFSVLPGLVRKTSTNSITNDIFTKYPRYCNLLDVILYIKYREKIVFLPFSWRLFFFIVVLGEGTLGIYKGPYNVSYIYLS
jgi:hypothetical protein